MFRLKKKNMLWKLRVIILLKPVVDDTSLIAMLLNDSAELSLLQMFSELDEQGFYERRIGESLTKSDHHLPLVRGDL